MDSLSWDNKADYEPIKQKNAFRWTNEYQAAFELLKNCLINSPILAHPNKIGLFTVTTDASDFALGTVLSQLQDEDKDYVVSYTSTQIPANTRDYVKDTYDVTRTTADNEIINTSRFKAGLMRPNKGTI